MLDIYVSKLINKIGALKFILSYIALCMIIILIFVASFIATNNNRYIFLEECERVAEDSVVFGKNQPYYLVYKDCNQPPKRIKIKNYIFVEK